MTLFRAKSPKEIVFRVRQIVWNYMDRMRYMKAFAASEQNTDLKNVPLAHTFFFDRQSMSKIVEMFSEVFPESAERILEHGKSICQHHFNILGHKSISFGDSENVNWHFDPVTGKCAPLLWWQDIDCSDTDVVGDPKIIWELNRHQHFLVLGMAYCLSGDPIYQAEFLSLLRSWFNANPPKKGINWVSSLELAYRSISWIWAFQLFDEGKGFPEELRSSFVHYLMIQGEHIEHNLSTYFSPNTHLTGEALGLLYIGLFLRSSRNSAKWVKMGKQILLEQLTKQILPDGGYMERSLWYHRYTIETYLHFYLLCRLHRIVVPENVQNRLESLADFLVYSSLPNRTLPLIGDDDGGRLLHLDGNDGSDLKGIFSTLAVIFNRGDFKYLSEFYQEETLWLLGPESRAVYERIEPHEPALKSKGFKECGYFFMRNSWSRDTNYLSFDCGPHGWLNCGHAHADLLSFQLHSGPQPIVVDSGTYTYCGDLRDYFRGPDGHSTIKINGFYPAIPDGPFSWRVWPRHKLIQWATTAEYDRVIGSTELNGGIKHLRELFFVKPDMFLIIDSLRGHGSCEVEIRFPLHGKQWEIIERKCISTNPDRPCSIESVTDGLCPRLIDSWTSLYYGHRMPSYTLLFQGAINMSCRAAFLINLSVQDLKSEILNQPDRISIKVLSKRSGVEIFSCESRDEQNVWNLRHI